MKKGLLYILVLFVLIGCSESEYDGSRTASLNKRYLSVKTSALTFDASASSKQVSIEADGTDWNISIPAEWVSVNPTSGNSSASVDFSTQLNNSADSSRVCVATIASNVSDWNRSFPVTITQQKNSPYITLSKSSMSCSAVKQNLSIPVSTNTAYTIENSASTWLHVESSSATGVNVSVDENNTEDERIGVLTLKAKSYSGVSAAISIRQKKANISSTMEDLKYGHTSSSQTIQIESEAAWTASATSWVSVNPTSGNEGKTDVTISVPNNASVKERTGSVYFTISGSNCIEVPVEQEGINLNISTSDISFDSFGGTQSVDVTSNDNWTIKSKPDWISANITSGEGNATIQFTTTENNTTTAKSGEIVISTTDNVTSKTINVSQKAKEIDYGDESLTFGYSSSTQTTSFTTDGNWTLTKNAEWISVDKTSGSGSATLSITVSENNDSIERYGNIYLTIAGQPYNISVHQDCKYLKLSSSAFIFDANAGKTMLSISSNTQWGTEIETNGTWLSVTPTTGENNAELTISTEENKTATSRSGKIKISIPNFKTYIVDVLQNRRYIKADMTSIDFLKSGGQITFNVITDGTYEVSKIGTWFGYIKSGDAITVVAQENTLGTERTGAIVLSLTNIEGGKVSLMVPVTQGCESNAKKTSNVVLKL